MQSSTGATQRLTHDPDLAQLQSQIWYAIDRELAPLDLTLSAYLKYRARLYARVCRLLLEVA